MECEEREPAKGARVGDAWITEKDVRRRSILDRFERESGCVTQKVGEVARREDLLEADGRRKDLGDAARRGVGALFIESANDVTWAVISGAGHAGADVGNA